VAEHTITQSARQSAEEIHRNLVEETDELRRVTLEESTDLRAQADEWAISRLEQLETILHKLMTSVEQGKSQMTAPPTSTSNSSYNSNSNSVRERERAGFE